MSSFNWEYDDKATKIRERQLQAFQTFMKHDKPLLARLSPVTEFLRQNQDGIIVVDRPRLGNVNFSKAENKSKLFDLARPLIYGVNPYACKVLYGKIADKKVIASIDGSGYSVRSGRIEIEPRSCMTENTLDLAHELGHAVYLEKNPNIKTFAEIPARSLELAVRRNMDIKGFCSTDRDLNFDLKNYIYYAKDCEEVKEEEHFFNYQAHGLSYYYATIFSLLCPKEELGQTCNLTQDQIVKKFDKITSNEKEVLNKIEKHIVDSYIAM